MKKLLFIISIFLLCSCYNVRAQSIIEKVDLTINVNIPKQDKKVLKYKAKQKEKKRKEKAKKKKEKSKKRKLFIFKRKK